MPLHILKTIGGFVSFRVELFTFELNTVFSGELFFDEKNLRVTVFAFFSEGSFATFSFFAVLPYVRSAAALYEDDNSLESEFLLLKNFFGFGVESLSEVASFSFSERDKPKYYKKYK